MYVGGRVHLRRSSYGGDRIHLRRSSYGGDRIHLRRSSYGGDRATVAELVRRRYRSDAAGNLRHWLTPLRPAYRGRCGWAGLWLGGMVRSVTAVSVA
ncbi:hypothetical protein [Kribbella yunnanensis]|uniref:hypothetical protein n=1 Tax=Kribbella yunnanensis TaxID=190194 RepID=UPI0031D2320F